MLNAIIVCLCVVAYLGIGTIILSLVMAYSYDREDIGFDLSVIVAWPLVIVAAVFCIPFYYLHKIAKKLSERY